MTSRSSPNLKPTLWDALVVLAVIVLGVVVALAVYGGKGADGALTCVITDHGEEVQRINMSTLDDAEYIEVIGDYHLTVRLSPNGVEVVESTCPHQDCVHSPRIVRAGESIVCLPAQIVIHLEGTPAADAPDVIVG